mmetsp:Transcript_11845/g.46255  ORF Transcript_11845/g.46255 Transcript_11845/m.46255 type:complete len:428 (+) Transcript_11845:696-1979(+)
MVGLPHTSSSSSRQCRSCRQRMGTTVLKPRRMARSCGALSLRRVATTRRAKSSLFSHVTRWEEPPGTSSRSEPSDSRVTIRSSTRSSKASRSRESMPPSACWHSSSTASRSEPVRASPRMDFHTSDGMSKGSANRVRRASPMRKPTNRNISRCIAEEAEGLGSTFSRFCPKSPRPLGHRRNSTVLPDDSSCAASSSVSRKAPPTSMLPSPARSTAQAWAPGLQLRKDSKSADRSAVNIWPKIVLVMSRPPPLALAAPLLLASPRPLALPCAAAGAAPPSPRRRCCPEPSDRLPASAPAASPAAAPPAAPWAAMRFTVMRYLCLPWDCPAWEPARLACAARAASTSVILVAVNSTDFSRNRSDESDRSVDASAATSPSATAPAPVAVVAAAAAAAAAVAALGGWCAPVASASSHDRPSSEASASETSA